MTELHPVAPPDDNPAHVDKRGRLPEEAKFDKRVYGGISYAAQAGSGILLTHWLRHGSGRPIFDKMANWLGPNFISKITSKRGAAAIKSADYWIVVTTMVNVGNLFLLPVKWLEDRKPQIVRGMTERDNERREAGGEVISEAERAEQGKHLALLADKPKQSWWSLLGGRAVGLGAVYAALPMIGNYNLVGEKLFSDVIRGGVDAAGLKQAAHSKTLDNYLSISFYDLFYSAVSAGGLYAYSHFIHPFKKATSPTDEVLPPLEEAVLEVVNGAPARQRSAGLPSPSMQVESIAHPQPQLAEVRA